MNTRLVAGCMVAIAIAIAIAVSCASPPASPKVNVASQPPIEPVAPVASSFVVLDEESKEAQVPTHSTSGAAFVLQARSPEAQVLWEITFKSIQSFGHDGKGSVVVVGERERDLQLAWVDGKGEVLWSELVKASVSWVGGPISEAGDMAVALADGALEVWRVGPRGRIAEPMLLKMPWHRQVLLTSTGNVVSADNGGSLLFMKADGTPLWTGSLTVPPGDVSYWSIDRPRLFSQREGRVWLFTADRTIVVHGPDGRRERSLGMRGWPAQLWELRDGDALAATSDCRLIRFAPDGVPRWSKVVADSAAWSCSWNMSSVAEEARGTLFVSVSPQGGDPQVRSLTAEGALRWKRSLTADSSQARLEPMGPDRVALIKKSGEREVVDNTTLDVEQDHGAVIHAGSFTLQLERPIDSGVALSEREAYVLSGERLWKWDGQVWTGGAKLRVALHPNQRDSIRLVGFDPHALVKGANGQAWLTGWRNAEGPMIPRVPTLLRLRRGVWTEDATVQRVFFTRMLEGTFHERGLRVAASGGNAIVCGELFCMHMENGQWAVQPLEREVSSVGVSGGQLWFTDSSGLQTLVSGRPKPDPGPRFSSSALWGPNPDHLWSIGPELVHCNLGVRRRWPSLVGDTTGIWGSGPNDIWVTGKGGVAHYDGQQFHRVAGLHGEVRGVFGAGAHRWFMASEGLWHFDEWAGRPASFMPIETSPPAPRREVRARQIAPCQGGYRTSAKTFAIVGTSALSAATEVSVAEDGTTWFRDGTRLVELDGASVRVLDDSVKGKGHRSLAPRGVGKGWFLGANGIVAVEGATRRLAKARLPDIQALAAWGAGKVKAVSAGDDDGLPHSVDWDGSAWALGTRLPLAAYVDVSMWGPVAWIAGGIHATRNNGVTWPAGEGIIWDGKGPWHRIPEGPILGIAAVAPEQAWAVGAAGLVVRIAGKQVNVQRIQPSNWLRDVDGTGPNDVWIVGDDDTLLHWNGTQMCRLGKLPLPIRSQLVSVASRGVKKAWVVSPDGILEVEAP